MVKGVGFPELEKHGVKGIKYFAKGKRGFIYAGFIYNGGHAKKRVAIKVKNPGSMAVDRIKNESKWLKVLNRRRIGPKLLFFSSNQLVYEFVEGDFIVDYIKKNKKRSIIKIIKGTFNQMYKLDMLGINKEEMHHPLKHIIITKKNAPVLIDFERTHIAKKPHNVTQFGVFIISSHMARLLQGKDILIDKKRLIALLRGYKKNMTKKNFNSIIKAMDS